MLTVEMIGERAGMSGPAIYRYFSGKDEILITYDGPILDHPTRYSIQIDENRHIEGTPESNAYLNHSCAPNTFVDWKGVFLRALRNIDAGEELTCNYFKGDLAAGEKLGPNPNEA